MAISGFVLMMAGAAGIFLSCRYGLQAHPLLLGEADDPQQREVAAQAGALQAILARDRDVGETPSADILGLRCLRYSRPVSEPEMEQVS